MKKFDLVSKTWEAFDMLSQAEYAVGLIASKTKEKEGYYDLEKAREKISEAEVIIATLLNLDLPTSTEKEEIRK